MTMSDTNMLKSVVRNCVHIDDTRERQPGDDPGPMTGPTWAKVSHICGIGSSSAMALCRRFMVDPFYDCSKDELDQSQETG